MTDLSAGTLEYVRHITAVEAGALIFGIGYVLLASREKVLCWPVGIIGSVLALAIAAKSNYRLDVVKESYYVLMGFYGWYAWIAGGKTETESPERTTIDAEAGTNVLAAATRPIVSYSVRQNATVILIGLLLSGIAGYIFDRIGSSLPYLDAATTIFAFITTWLVTQKVLENWLFWIVINAAAFYMYWLNGYFAFSLLMIIYLIVSVTGYLTWRRQYREAMDSREVAR